MGLTLSTPQKTELDERGFLVVPNAIDEAELVRLRRAFERAESQGGTEHAHIPEAMPDADAWQRFAALPVVHAAAQHILGRPFRVSQLHGRNPIPGYGQQGIRARKTEVRKSDAQRKWFYWLRRSIDE